MVALRFDETSQRPPRVDTFWYAWASANRHPPTRPPAPSSQNCLRTFRNWLYVIFVPCDPDILTRVFGSKVELWPKVVQLTSPSWEWRTASKRQRLNVLTRGYQWGAQVRRESDEACTQKASETRTKVPVSSHFLGPYSIPVLGFHDRAL